MKYPLYAVRDVRVGFMTPTVDQNELSAIRNFKHACMNPDSLMHTHPDEFSLYQIGEYESDTGVVTPILVKLVAEASDLV